MFFSEFGRRAFAVNERGTVAVMFTLAIIPVMMMVGLALDYARGLAVAARTQAALDAAVLSAMSQNAGSRAAAASDFFLANLNLGDNTIVAQNFVEATSGNLTGTAKISVPTSVMSVVIPSISLTRSSGAALTTVSTGGSPSTGENSCILTLGEQLTVSSDVMTFNGSPAVNLTGCNLRSDKSMDCNGHSTGAQTYAVGSIVGCSYPHSGQLVVPDIYSSLSSNIVTVCGASAGGYTWTANGNLPAAAANQIILVAQSGYSEIHVCGNLTLSGTSSTTLTGATPVNDTVVVVENGGIIIGDGTNVVANRVTFVLAGGSVSSIVSWPTGNGGSASSLSVSASTGASNPWRGMAIYENPSLNVDMTWKSGTTFTLDGVLYFPRASFTVSGQVVSGSTGCSKIVVGQFTLNGSVDMKQSDAACTAMQVSQYAFPDTTTTTTALQLTQ
jgi:Flp pilus assembly protein TadG